ncbi:MAG: hypothetical protein HYU64_19580 [Armatimonadetes bacterium]|nr:hypothetical protein [Armatimonadota bacterium]
MSTTALSSISGATQACPASLFGKILPYGDLHALSLDRFRESSLSSEGGDEKQTNWKNVAKLALGAAVGAGLGVAAGLYTGELPAIAGAISGLAGGVATGVLAGAYLGDKFGAGESPKVAGIALTTTLAAAAVGLAGGIYVGARVSSPWAAVAFGALGAFGGFGKALLGIAGEEPPGKQ